MKLKKGHIKHLYSRPQFNVSQQKLNKIKKVRDVEILFRSIAKAQSLGTGQYVSKKVCVNLKYVKSVLVLEIIFFVTPIVILIILVVTNDFMVRFHKHYLYAA